MKKIRRNLCLRLNPEDWRWFECAAAAARLSLSGFFALAAREKAISLERAYVFDTERTRLVMLRLLLAGCGTVEDVVTVCPVLRQAEVWSYFFGLEQDHLVERLPTKKGRVAQWLITQGGRAWLEARGIKTDEPKPPTRGKAG